MATKIVSHLAENILTNRKALCEWQREKGKKIPLPFYCSVDLRDSGYKVVPVDSNLYPAGFNNICPEDRRTAPVILKEEIQKLQSNLGVGAIKKILLLPESHTQNKYYIENLYYLEKIIQDAGFETRIGWYGDFSEQEESSLPTEMDVVQLTSFTGKELKAHPISIENQILSARGFRPDLILLNNDFSGGYPKPLDKIRQPIVPSHILGWHSRKKSEHFKYYNELAAEFSSIAKIDPWLIQIETEEVTPVNFNEEIGIDKVAQSVDRIIGRTQEAYKVHQIKRKPFVFIKNNSGTYGMGIMVVHSSEELAHLNRRMKNKMSVGKNRAPIESVVVQEGIPTATLVNNFAAEPVIYLFGNELIGGFLRSNTEKSDEDNLNSQGMVFKMLCMSDLRTLDTEFAEREDLKNEPLLERAYGSIAQLSVFATGIELEKNLERLNSLGRGLSLFPPCFSA